MIEDDDSDSGEISSAVMAQFQSLADQQCLVEFQREDLESNLTGFILDFNSEFMLLQLINDDFDFGGYSIIMIEEVTLVQWGSKLQNRIERFLKDRRPNFPEAPSLFLESWDTIIKGLSERDIAICVYRESLSEGILMTDSFQVLDELVVMETINLDGEREGQAMFVADSISQIDFLDSYSQNLSALSKVS